MAYQSGFGSPEQFPFLQVAPLLLDPVLDLFQLPRPVRLLHVALGVELPSATLSIVARVPSYSLAPCVLPLAIQVVDYSFPGGLPTLLT
jgi:hypothetical protein